MDLSTIDTKITEAINVMIALEDAIVVDRATKAQIQVALDAQTVLVTSNTTLIDGLTADKTQLTAALAQSQSETQVAMATGAATATELQAHKEACDALNARLATAEQSAADNKAAADTAQAAADAANQELANIATSSDGLQAALDRAKTILSPEPTPIVDPEPIPAPEPTPAPVVDPAPTAESGSGIDT
jgi:chromosome segregation ATPase